MPPHSPDEDARKAAMLPKLDEIVEALRGLSDAELQDVLNKQEKRRPQT